MRVYAKTFVHLMNLFRYFHLLSIFLLFNYIYKKDLQFLWLQIFSFM